MSLKIPIQELREWPIDVIDDYRAYDLLTPFTPRAQMHREGFIAASIRNQNCTKQSQIVRADELFPYLKDGVPDYLEDPTILEVKRSLSNLFVPLWVRQDLCEQMRNVINEELDKPQKEQDTYLIQGLYQILKVQWPIVQQALQEKVKQEREQKNNKNKIKRIIRKL